jgi:hypothetical protein
MTLGREEQWPAQDEPDGVLLELEEQHARLTAELAAVELRLREVRTTANLCPNCGGTGRRRTRGGLYGETQDRPCDCETT